MFGLVSFVYGLLFLGSLFVVYFRWFRSGSPNKLASVSSSYECEEPEHYANQEENGREMTVGSKVNGGETFVQKSIEAQQRRNDHLRRPSSDRNSKPQKGDDIESSASRSTESDASEELLNNLNAAAKENEIVSSEGYVGVVLPASETKEVKKHLEETNELITNVEASANPLGNHAASESFKTTECVAQEFTLENDTGNSNESNNTQETFDINNTFDLGNECLTGPMNAVKNNQIPEIRIQKVPAELNRPISGGSLVELPQESNFSSVECESTIKQQIIPTHSTFDDSDLDVVDECANPLSFEEINPKAKIGGDERFGVVNCDSFRGNVTILNQSQCANAVQTDSQNILDTYDNDVASPDDAINAFSDRLTKCIINAILQDTHLLFSQSGDEDGEKHGKELILKFSDLLAASIVKSVFDFSKENQEHIAEQDEHDQLSANVPDVTNECKTSEHNIHDVLVETSPTNEDEMFGTDEANDVCNNLHEYAKRLSIKILNDVLETNRESSFGLSKNAYASKLAKHLLSTALSDANSHIGNNNSDSVDLFVTEIVGNAIETAISRITMETCNANEEHNEVNSVISEHYGEHVAVHQHVESHSRIHVGVGEVHEHLEACANNNASLNNHLGHEHGETEPESSISERQPGRKNNEMELEIPNFSKSQSVPSGKLQSKWLSEEDLEELDNDDFSDEEAQDDSLKLLQNSCNDNKPVMSASCLQTPKDGKEFWRKSLIDDLDNDFDFEEIETSETSHSSLSSSPSKSGNFDDLMAERNADVGAEGVEASDNVKAQPSIVKPAEARRSRLRSVDTSPVLVFDNGSAFLKIGFSDQVLPKEIVSSVVGTPLRYSQDISGMDYTAKPGLIFGGNATNKAGVLHIEYPLKSDLVEKWSDVEGLWDYALNSLMCIQDNPDFPVLISQPALNPKKNADKIAEIMFEHFNMPSLFIADQLTLSLYSMGYTSGVSFSSGFKSTQAGVVYEGHLLPHTVQQLDIAGYQLTENLKKLLMSLQGFGFRSSSQWQIVDDIKKKLGFFSLDFDAESKRYKSKAGLQTTYELPDGQVIEVGLERFGCAESMFKPSELGLTQLPAHMLIIDAINSCEKELQEACYKAMGVSGGTTKMTGFVARLEQELRMHDRKFKKLTSPEHRDLATWLGGAVMASLPTFREMVVSVDEYAEYGARVIHSKCF